MPATLWRHQSSANYRREALHVNIKCWRMESFIYGTRKLCLSMLLRYLVYVVWFVAVYEINDFTTGVIYVNIVNNLKCYI